MSIESIQKVDTFSWNWYLSYILQKSCINACHANALWIVHNINVNQFKILSKEVYYNFKNGNRSDCHFIINYFVNCYK